LPKRSKHGVNGVEIFSMQNIVWPNIFHLNDFSDLSHCKASKAELLPNNNKANPTTSEFTTTAPALYYTIKNY
jgi:hypothetical protein